MGLKYVVIGSLILGLLGIDNFPIQDNMVIAQNNNPKRSSGNENPKSIVNTKETNGSKKDNDRDSYSKKSGIQVVDKKTQATQQEQKVQAIQSSMNLQNLQAQINVMNERLNRIENSQGEIKNLIANVSSANPTISGFMGAFLAVLLCFLLYELISYFFIDSKEENTGNSIRNISRQVSEISANLLRLLNSTYYIKENIREINGLKNNLETSFVDIKKQISVLSLLLARSDKNRLYEQQNNIPEKSKESQQVIEPETKKYHADMLYLGDDGILQNYPDNAQRYNVGKEKIGGIPIAQKVFVESNDGNYIIIANSSNPNKGECYPLDVKQLDSQDIIYPLERKDGTLKWEILKVAKCKKESNRWILDGEVGKIIGPSGF